MQLTHNLMDLYFNYNGRVGDVKGAQEGIEEFEQIAKTASTEEEKLRYEQAAEKLKIEILPKMQKEMEQLAKELGLDSSDIGKVAKADSKESATLAIRQQPHGQLLLLNSYEVGNYYHNKI